MASPVDSLRGLLKKQDVLLMALCALLAVGFLALGASNLTLSANFLTIDNLFFTTVCLLLALTFISIPALYLKERGVLANPFAVGGEVPASRAAEHVHFEGSTKLFLSILGALLLLTLVEVVLAYIHLNLILMLVILIGLSLVKAALIMGYFMHLKFERMSLVLTLVPILVVCICLLLVFFPDSMRSRELRTTKSSAAAGAAEH